MDNGVVLLSFSYVLILSPFDMTESSLSGSTWAPVAYPITDLVFVDEPSKVPLDYSMVRYILMVI